MDIEDLRTFVVVADAGGVTPAALRLGVSKSMVSRRLARLEAELGVQLLARSTRGASLTEAGATFPRLCCQGQRRDRCSQRYDPPAGELSGRLRIAAPLSFGPTHFASVLADMALRHPQLQIQTSYSDRFVDLIAEGFDCAIRVGTLQDSNLIARRVGPLYGKYVASPAYIKAHGSPETPEELVTHQALMQGMETWQVMDGDKILTIRPQGRFKADNGAALVVAAAAGWVSPRSPMVLPRSICQSGTLVTVMKNHPPPPADFVVRPPGQHPSRKSAS